MHLFIELPPFTKACEYLLGDEALQELQRFLSAHPDSGDVVPGTGGVRKLRWSRPGMGKRGGVRVLYYVQDEQGRIWLLTLYAKSQQDNIGAEELHVLRRMADHAEIE